MLVRADIDEKIVTGQPKDPFSASKVLFSWSLGHPRKWSTKNFSPDRPGIIAAFSGITAAFSGIRAAKSLIFVFGFFSSGIRAAFLGITAALLGIIAAKCLGT